MKLNPLGYVPVLVDGETTLADSFAILMVCLQYFLIKLLIMKDIRLLRSPDFSIASELHCMLCDVQYLEEKYPQHPLLPSDPIKRAINYQVIAFDHTMCLFCIRMQQVLQQNKNTFGFN